MDSFELITVSLSIGGVVFMAGGVFVSIKNIKDRVLELEKDSKKYISETHFNQVTTDLKQSLDRLQDMMHSLILSLGRTPENHK